MALPTLPETWSWDEFDMLDSGEDVIAARAAARRAEILARQIAKVNESLAAQSDKS